MTNPSMIQFELRKRFSEAISKGRYFITITSLDPKENRLHHYYARENFKTEDMVPSLVKQIEDIEKTELPLEMIDPAAEK